MAAIDDLLAAVVLEDRRGQHGLTSGEQDGVAVGRGMGGGDDVMILTATFETHAATPAQLPALAVVVAVAVLDLVVVDVDLVVVLDFVVVLDLVVTVLVVVVFTLVVVVLVVLVLVVEVVEVVGTVTGLEVVPPFPLWRIAFLMP